VQHRLAVPMQTRERSASWPNISCEPSWGRFLGPVGCAALGVAFVLGGLFELFIAQIMGPDNSDELVTGGPVVVPWFGLPLAAIASACVAVAHRSRLRFAYRALRVAAGCVVAWWVLAAVVAA
jgi:hypothetical protein